MVLFISDTSTLSLNDVGWWCSILVSEATGFLRDFYGNDATALRFTVSVFVFLGGGGLFWFISNLSVNLHHYSAISTGSCVMQFCNGVLSRLSLSRKVTTCQNLVLKSLFNLYWSHVVKYLYYKLNDIQKTIIRYYSSVGVLVGFVKPLYTEMCALNLRGTSRKHVNLK